MESRFDGGGVEHREGRVLTSGCALLRTTVDRATIRVCFTALDPFFGSWHRTDEPGFDDLQKGVVSK